MYSLSNLRMYQMRRALHEEWEELNSMIWVCNGLISEVVICYIVSLGSAVLPSPSIWTEIYKNMFHGLSFPLRVPTEYSLSVVQYNILTRVTVWTSLCILITGGSACCHLGLRLGMLAVLPANMRLCNMVHAVLSLPQVNNLECTPRRNCGVIW